MPSAGNCLYAGVDFSCCVSAGGQPVSLTSTSPELNACSAVEPSGMIFRITLFSLTLLASRQPSHFVSTTWALCCHCVSLNGPFVTMWAGSVHLLPHFSTVALLTARNDVWPSCWMNHGCGEVSTTLIVYLSGAEIPTLLFIALQSSFFGSQPL
jgi:hypothetical protein